MFSSLKIRDFRIFWASMFISLIGSWVQSMAQSWLVFKLTHSAFLLGLVGFLSYLPVSLFSLAAGVFVDRVVKRNLLIATQIALMCLAFILGFLVKSQLVQVWHIVVIAILNGIVLSIDAPARQSMVVELVGKQHLLNAIALNSAAFNSARVIGPALAGILIALIGMEGCFFVNALSFLPVVAALFLIRPKPMAADFKNKTFIQDLREAMFLIKNNHFVLGILWLVGLVSIFGVSYIIFMPIFASDVLHSGSKGLALLMTANGLGALAAAFRMARLKQAVSKTRVLETFIFIFFIAVMLFAWSKSMTLSFILLVLAGYGGSGSVALANTLLQISIPDEYRGRVMGVFIMMFMGLLPFGNLISGFFAHFIGAPLVVFLGAFFSILLYIPLAKKYLNPVACQQDLPC